MEKWVDLGWFVEEKYEFYSYEWVEVVNYVNNGKFRVKYVLFCCFLFFFRIGV